MRASLFLLCLAVNMYANSYNIQTCSGKKSLDRNEIRMMNVISKGQLPRVESGKGLLRKAIREISSATLANKDPDVNYVKAQIYNLLGNEKKSLIFFEKAVFYGCNPAKPELERKIEKISHGKMESLKYREAWGLSGRGLQLNNKNHELRGIFLESAEKYIKKLNINAVGDVAEEVLKKTKSVAAEFKN